MTNKRKNELESNAIRAASEALEQNPYLVKKELTLSNGIILKLKVIPPLLISSVGNTIPEPEVPVVFIEDKGRDEPNPNHPAYINALKKRDDELNLATMNLILYAGTELKFVPEGLYKPEDQGWRKLALMAGMEFDENDPGECYIAWLRSYALSTLKDLEQSQTLPLMLAGVTEEEVARIANSFPGGEERGTDNPVPTEIRSENGDNLQQPNRRTRRANRGA